MTGKIGSELKLKFTSRTKTNTDGYMPCVIVCIVFKFVLHLEGIVLSEGAFTLLSVS